MYHHAQLLERDTETQRGKRIILNRTVIMMQTQAPDTLLPSQPFKCFYTSHLQLGEAAVRQIATESQDLLGKLQTCQEAAHQQMSIVSFLVYSRSSLQALKQPSQARAMGRGASKILGHPEHPRPPRGKESETLFSLCLIKVPYPAA
jgi:hypothetical protein